MYNKDMFWDNVKTILSQNKILQKDFADKLGYNLSTVKNQMARNISPSVDEAVKIAQALNTTVEYLVTGEEINKAQQELDTLKQKLKELIE
jgi:transcriptional regulator with XRE-family HTH domain